MTAGFATFATAFLPRWLELVADRRHGGVAESVDPDGRPDRRRPRSTLTQARCAFALAHLHLVTKDPHWLRHALEVWRFVDTHLRDPDGGYRSAVAASGAPLDDAASRRRSAYDQSFALLALVTLRRAAPEAVPADRVDALWRFVERLTDPRTGALWQDDAMARAGTASGRPRGQNPQMHMLEAVLQAHEMTGDALWMTRAERYVSVARDHLIDARTGAVREWLGDRLQAPVPAESARVEPGHQFEWAWLLDRYADFGGDPEARRMAARMQRFADEHGVRASGPLAGAPHDALDAAGTVVEDAHRLWPLTEAGKRHAALHAAHGDPRTAAAARALERLIFERFFTARTFDGEGGLHWNNRLDAAARPLEREALSRLVYHLVLFLTEGARASLWPLPDDTSRHVTSSRERKAS